MSVGMLETRRVFNISMLFFLLLFEINANKALKECRTTTIRIDCAIVHALKIPHK